MAARLHGMHACISQPSISSDSLNLPCSPCSLGRPALLAVPLVTLVLLLVCENGCGRRCTDHCESRRHAQALVLSLRIVGGRGAGHACCLVQRVRTQQDRQAARQPRVRAEDRHARCCSLACRLRVTFELQTDGRTDGHSRQLPTGIAIPPELTVPSGRHHPAPPVNGPP